MKKLTKPIWQEKFSGKHILNLKDTCRVIVRPVVGNKFSWELTVPPGKLIHGVCSTLAEAQSASRVLSTLTILEMKHLIRRLPGGYLTRGSY